MHNTKGDVALYWWTLAENEGIFMIMYRFHKKSSSSILSLGYMLLHVLKLWADFSGSYYFKKKGSDKEN